MGTYDYSDLRAEIMQGVREASKSAMIEGIAKGISDAMAQSIKISNSDKKKFTDSIEQQLDSTLSEVDLTSLKLGRVKGLSLDKLFNLDNTDLIKKINEYYQNAFESANPNASINKFIVSMTVALQKMSEDMIKSMPGGAELLEVYSSYLSEMKTNRNGNVTDVLTKESTERQKTVDLINAQFESQKDVVNAILQEKDLLDIISSMGMENLITSASNQIEAQQELNKQLEETKQLRENINSLSGNTANTEQGMAFNTSGKYSTQMFSGEVTSLDYNEILKSAAESINAFLHTHPNELVSAFSFDDILAAAKMMKEGITQQFVLASNQISSLDLSGLSSDVVSQIGEKLKELTMTDSPFGNGELTIDDEKAYLYEYKNNLIESVEIFLNQIISELSKSDAKVNIDLFQKQLFLAANKEVVALSGEIEESDDVVYAIQDLFTEVAGKFHIPEDTIKSVFDNAFVNYDSAMIQQFQEHMLRQAFESIVKNVDFDSVYSKSSFSDFAKKYGITLPSQNTQTYYKLNADAIRQNIDALNQEQTAVDAVNTAQNELNNTRRAEPEISSSVVSEAEASTSAINAETTAQEELNVARETEPTSSQSIIDGANTAADAINTETVAQENLNAARESEPVSSQLVIDNTNTAIDAINSETAAQENLNSAIAEEPIPSTATEENGQKAITVLSELGEKIKEIQDFSEDFSILKYEGDTASLKNIIEVLSSLTQSDLESLGMKAQSIMKILSAIEDLRERMESGSLYAFESDIYGDESYMSDERISDYYDEYDTRMDTRNEQLDKSSILVDRFMSRVSELDLSKFTQQVVQESAALSDSTSTEEEKITTDERDNQVVSDGAGIISDHTDKVTADTGATNENTEAQQQYNDSFVGNNASLGTNNELIGVNTEQLQGNNTARQSNTELIDSNTKAITDNNQARFNIPVTSDLSSTTENVEENTGILQNNTEAINENNQARNNISNSSDVSSATEKVKENSDAVQNNVEVENKAANASTDTTNTQVRNLQTIRDEIAKTQQKIDELYDSAQKYPDTNTILGRYTSKMSEYSSLSVKELEKKYAEKLANPTQNYTGDMTKVVDNLEKKWSGIIALIDTIKAKTGETKDITGFVNSDSLDELDLFYNRIRDILNLTKTSNGSYKSIEGLIREATQAKANLEREKQEYLKTSASNEEIADEKFTQAIDKFENDATKGVRATKALRESFLELRETIPDAQIEDYTSDKTVIETCNLALQQQALMEKQAQEAAEEKAAAERAAAEAAQTGAQADQQSAQAAQDEAQAQIEAAAAKEGVVSQVGETSAAASSAELAIETSKSASKIVGYVGIEKDAFKQLANYINTDLIQAIDNKTEAFKREREIVGSVVYDEQTDLRGLSNSLFHISNQLTTLSETKFKGSFAMDGLKSAVNNLKQLENTKIPDSINDIIDWLHLLAEETSNMNISDTNILSVLNSIVSEADALKSLGTILKSTKEEIDEAVKTAANTDKIKKETEAIEAQKKALAELTAAQKSAKTVSNQANSILNFYDNNKKVQNYMPEVESQVEALREKLKSLPAVINSDNVIQTKANIAQIQEMIDTLRSDKNNRWFLNIDEKDKANIQKTIGEISTILFRNTAMSDGLRSQFEEIQLEYQNLFKSGGAEVALDRLNTRLQELVATMKTTEQTGLSFFDKVAYRAKSMSQTFLARYLSLYRIVGYVKELFTTIEDLDTALVDLKKTTAMTNTELETFYNNASDIAIQTGVTTEEIISQAAAWSRLGYSAYETSTQMAQLSSQFAAISPGMDTDTATDGLVSSMKAFGIATEDVEREIMDNINRIGNTMATTNEEIVDMLERSSSAMAAANNSIEETIALESAAVEVTRDADTTGTAFKTISMRIRGYDEETEELSDDLENISGKIADLTKVNGKGGVSLFTDETKTTYKSTYQILKDISEVYDQLTDKNQAELLEALGGKRSGQVIATILNDFSSAEKAMVEMENAAGSADAEMGTIEESIEYKLNALKQTWVGFLQEILQRDDVADVVDSLIEGSEGLTKALDTLGPLLKVVMTLLSDLAVVLGDVCNIFGNTTPYVLGLSAAVAKGFKNNTFKKWAKDIRYLAEAEAAEQAIQEESTVVNEAAAAAKEANAAASESEAEAKLKAMGVSEEEIAAHEAEIGVTTQDTVATQTLTETEMTENATTVEGVVADETSSAAKGVNATVTETLNAAEVSENATTVEGTAADVASAGAIGTETSAKIADVTATNLLTAAGKKLLAVISAHPFLVLAAAVAAVVVVLKQASQAQEELNDKAKELGENIKDTTSDIDDYKTKITALQETINDSSTSINDSIQAREDLYAIQDEMIEKYGAEAGAIDNITAAIEGEIDALDEVGRKEYEQGKNSHNEYTNGQKVTNFLTWGTTNPQSVSSNMDDVISAFESGRQIEVPTNWLRDGWNSFVYGTAGNADLDQELADLLGLYQKFDGYGKSYISGTIGEDIYEARDMLDKAISYLEENHPEATDYIQTLTSQYNEIVDYIKDNEDLYNQHIYYDVILNPKDDTYKNIVDQLNDIYDQYTEAAAKGDTETANQLANQYSEILAKGTAIALENGEQGAYDYLVSLYPQMQAFFDEHKIQLYFTTDDGFENHQQQLSEAANSFANAGLTNSDDIADYLNGSDTERISGYDTIHRIAGDLKVSTDEVIDYMLNQGMIVTAQYEETVEKFGEDAVNHLSEEYLNIVTENTDEIYTQYIKNLNSGLDAVDALDAAVKQFKIDSKEAEEFDISSFSENIDELKKLQSLYSDFRNNIEDDPTKITLDLSDVEDLRENWEGIVGSDEFNEFEIIVTSDTSSVDDIEKAFSDMVTSYVNATISAQGANQETIEMIKSQLKLAGLTSDSADSYIKWMTDYADAEKYAGDIGIDLENVTSEDIAKFKEEAETSTISKNALYALEAAMIQTAYADGEMDFSSSIAAIQELAQNAGVAVNELIALKAAASFDNQVNSTGQGTLYDYYSGLSDSEKQQARSDYVSNAVTEFQNEISNVKLSFDPLVDQSASGGSDSGDAYVDAYEAEVEKLDELKENKLITEKQYLQYLQGLYKKYFENIDKYSEKFYEEQMAWLEKVAEYMESVGSAITTLLDARIDAAQKSMEKATDAIDDQTEAIDDEIDRLTDEKEAAVDAIQEQIDAKQDLIDKYQDQIDAMDKANEARERELALQEALYNLEKAQNQKSKLVYDKENGFTYQADSDAITEARQNVEDAKYDIEKAKIQDIIDKIQEEVDALEDQKEKIEEFYDDQIEALEKEKEALEKDKEAIEDYWNAIIDGLEEQKSKWEELMNLKEIAEAYDVVQAYFGDLGYTIEDVLNGSGFDQFAQDYMSVLSDMGTSTEGLGWAWNTNSETFGSSIGAIGSYLDTTKESADKVTTAIKAISTALPDATSAAEQVATVLTTAFGTTTSAVQDLNSALSGDGSDNETTGDSQEKFGGRRRPTPSDYGNDDGDTSSISGDSTVSAIESIGTAAKENIAGTAVDAMQSLLDKGEETTTTLIGDEGTGFTGLDAKIKESALDIGDDKTDGTLINEINKLGATSSALEPLRDVVSELASALSEAATSLSFILSNIGLSTLTGSNNSGGGGGRGFVNGQNNNPARAWGQNNQIPHGNNTDKTLVGKYLLTLNLFNCWETLRDNLTTT